MYWWKTTRTNYTRWNGASVNKRMKNIHAHIEAQRQEDTPPRHGTLSYRPLQTKQDQLSKPAKPSKTGTENELYSHWHASESGIEPCGVKSTARAQKACGRENECRQEEEEESHQCERARESGQWIALPFLASSSPSSLLWFFSVAEVEISRRDFMAFFWYDSSDAPLCCCE